MTEMIPFLETTNHAMRPGTSRVIRVLVVDDHPIVREGLALRISLEPDMRVCGQADDVPQALQIADLSNADVAVIDISLKTGHGIELIKRLKDRNNAARIVVWSMHSEDLYAERVLRAGALGYVNKAEATEKLIDAIRKVFERKIVVSPKLSETLVSRSVGLTNSGSGSPSLDLLSDRELEVFHLLGDEYDLKQIATRLCVSPKTVETYCSRIKVKLHISSGRELLTRAVQWTLKDR